MNKLLSLYQKLNKNGVRFYQWDMPEDPATTLEIGGNYGIFMDFDNIASPAAELVTVAHEGGHCSTGATHRVSSPYDLIEKHENKAWRWAVHELITEDELDDAVAGGHTELWDLADYFGVTEDFMQKTICYYTYGNLATELYF